MSESSAKEARQTVDTALEETIGNAIVLMATTQKAVPESAKAMEALRVIFGQLVSLSKGPKWMADHEPGIDRVIQVHVGKIKASIESQLHPVRSEQTGQAPSLAS